jgi:hypothetical protein
LEQAVHGDGGALTFFEFMGKPVGHHGAHADVQLDHAVHILEHNLSIAGTVINMYNPHLLHGFPPDERQGT